jgi:hypothetical protein
MPCTLCSWWFSEEEAHHVVPGLVFALEQHPNPHCRLSPVVSGIEKGQDDPPPSLFARSRPTGLFLFPRGEVRANWPLTIAGQLQDELGGVVRTIPSDKFSSAFQRWNTAP